MTVIRAHDKALLSAPAPRWLVRLTTVTLSGLALAALAVLVWSLPRGFGITDESFYLLNYRYPHEYGASFSSFHLLVTKGLGLTDCSVLCYRAAAVIATCLGSVIFGWCLARWLRIEVPMGSRWLMQSGLVIGCVLLGSLLVYSIFPRTLSYNSINSFFILLGAAAVLAALRCGPTGSYWLLGAGMALGLDIFIKLSTAALVGGSEVLLLAWCWHRAGSKALSWAALLLLAGVGIGVVVYFLGIQKPGIWYHNFTQEMAVIQQGAGYRMTDLLPAYLRNGIQTVSFLLYPMGPALLVLLGLAWWWPRRAAPAAWHGPVALGLLGAVALPLAWLAITRHWYSNAFSNKYETLPLLLALVLLVAGVFLVQAPVAGSSYQPTPARPAQVVPVGCWLFMLPFLSAAGTINDLRLNLLVDAAPWFAVLLLLLTSPRFGRLPAWVVAGLLLLPAGFAAEQVIWGTLFTPYSLTQPMSRQTVPLRTAGLPTPVLVDAGTAAFFGQLAQLLALGGFRPGDPLLAFYDASGLVYACGGVSPGAAWYFPGRDARNCHALAITKLPLQRACIIVSRPLGAAMQSCLHTHGLNFPQGYRLVGELVNPYAANLPPADFHTISVYAPVN